MPAKAQIDLVARDRGFQKAARGAEGALRKLGKRMEGVTRAARRVFVVMAGGVTAAGVTFAMFEQRMARVKALTGETGAEFAKLNDTARELGKTTVFSAGQAAEAMGFFAQSGFTTNEILKAMPKTLALAAAGQLDMATAADITAKIMRGMRIEAENVGQAVDVLAKAFTTSNTDLQQLGEGMKFVGPIAASMGKELEEVVASLQVLSDAGIQAAMAGTGLRKILLTLGGGRASREFAKLGVSLREVDGKLRPIPDLIDDISGAMDKLDPLKKAEIMALFGDRAGPALAVLLDKGGDALRDYEKRLDGAAGTAQRIADIQLDTLAGAFKILQSTVMEMGIAIGQSLRPALLTLIDTFTSLTSKVNESSDAMKQWIAGIGIGTLVVSGSVIVLGAFVKALAALTFAARVAAPAIGAVFAFLGAPAVVAITALGVAIGVAKGKTASLQAEMESVARSSRKAAQAFVAFKDARDAADKAETPGAKVKAEEQRVASLRALVKAQEDLVKKEEAVPRETVKISRREQLRRGDFRTREREGARPNEAALLAARRGLEKLKGMSTDAVAELEKLRQAEARATALAATKGGLEDLIAGHLEGARATEVNVSAQKRLAETLVDVRREIELINIEGTRGAGAAMDALRGRFAIEDLAGAEPENIAKLREAFRRRTRAQMLAEGRVSEQEAVRGVQSRLKALNREMDVLQGVATAEDFELRDLLASLPEGAIALRQSLRDAFSELAGMRDRLKEDEDTGPVGGMLEGLEQTFQRIQSAAAATDPAIRLAERTSKASQTIAANSTKQLEQAKITNEHQRRIEDSLRGVGLMS